MFYVKKWPGVRVGWLERAFWDWGVAWSRDGFYADLGVFFLDVSWR